MGLRIHQLPPAIANQIAAGEVIERPASVVKELLENSLDAGANSISIEIGYGGLNQIKISDNGSGIVAEDLPLAIAAHATSKIQTLDDLYAIDSMGFRGEALASIASVAKVSISSRPSHQENAMMLHVQGAEFTLSPCARNQGTTIDVVDLFFNAPVRKRFLKNEKLEFQAIEMVIKRFALSAPNIALTLKHNGKLIFSLPSALSEHSKLTRMTKILGNAFMKDAIYLDVELGGMRLYGWLSGPNYQRSQNDRQWVYVNQRMVKDKLINHALKQAYDGLLHPGRFPACLLYFIINSAEMDVNVHPTKHEVRFQQPRIVHDFFTSQLQKALNLKTINNHEGAYVPHAINSLRVCESYVGTDQVISNLGNEVFTSLGMESVFGGDDRRVLRAKTGSSLYSSGSETAWIILNNRYILVFLKQQPYVVDVVALQQQWLNSLLNKTDFPFKSRPLLVPINYPLPPKLKTEIDKLKQRLGQLGLHIECSSMDIIIIHSVPVQIPYLDIRLFIDSVAKLDSLDMKQLVELLSQSQVFDPRSLSNEERMELNQLLLNDQNQEFYLQSIYKALTVDDCRKLLHV